MSLIRIFVEILLKHLNFQCSYCSHRNTQIRKLAAKYICVAIEVHEPSRFLRSNKDVLEKALPAIVQFTKDSSPDCRYYGRKCLNMLWPEPDYNHVTNRVLKNDLYTVAREAVETLKLKVSNKGAPFGC